MRRVRIVRGTTCVALLALAACAGSGSTGGSGVGASTTGTSGASASSTGIPYGRGADVLFAQMVLLHHRQTLQLVEMLDARSGIRPEVVETAHRLREIESPEVGPLTSWLAEWKAPEAITNHTGHPMRGILIDVQFGALDALDGSEFERQWILRMIEHQDGGTAFASAVLRQTSDPRVQELAHRLIQRLPGQVVELQKLRTG